ncbi:MAG TPA: hypothetical protein VK284_14645 [Streptosporangiaceae bacterium]|nr:hypothetical protein [Streptosporangiaceae bacterium]HLN70204.1 hypothetical protein [Streptosporangiaceae bacterium]
MADAETAGQPDAGVRAAPMTSMREKPYRLARYAAPCMVNLPESAIVRAVAWLGQAAARITF